MRWMDRQTDSGTSASVELRFAAKKLKTRLRSTLNKPRNLEFGFILGMEDDQGYQLDHCHKLSKMAKSFQKIL